MSRAGAAGAALATAGGALLVVSLLLSWWGTPTDLLDPPADLPGELDFLAEALQDAQQDFAGDAFEFFDFRDALWLATGIFAFAFGLGALTGLRFTGVLGAITTSLAAASLVFVAITLISPPDYLDVTAERFDEDPYGDFDYDLPFSRKLGGFVALAASAAALAGSILTIREIRR